MKKALLFITVVAIAFFTLVSCSSDRKLSEDEKELERIMELEERFEKGYDVGFSEGYDFGYEDCQAVYESRYTAALDYAKEEGGWSVYEACTNVLIYMDGYAPEGCEFPTWEEYQDSIITLAYFAEYLESHRLS